jgi:hypothetical protein
LQFSFIASTSESESFVEIVLGDLRKFFLLFDDLDPVFDELAVLLLSEHEDEGDPLCDDFELFSGPDVFLRDFCELIESNDVRGFFCRVQLEVAEVMDLDEDTIGDRFLKNEEIVS